MTETTTDNFFDGVGGGAPSFKFEGINTGVRGTITDQYLTHVTQPDGTVKTYDDGREIPQLNVTLQTELRNWDKVTKIPTDQITGQPKAASEDDGLRRIYVKYDMKRAVGVAVKAVKETALRNGGTLAVKKSGEKPTGKGNPLPLYEARYEAPTGSDAFFDGGAQAAPAQPVATPAAQPVQQAAPVQDPWATPAAAPVAAAPAAPQVYDEPPF